MTESTGLDGQYQDNNVDFIALFSAIARRKRIILVVFVSTFLFSAGYSVYRRLVAPLYRGSFTLLITDPITQERTLGTTSRDDLFQQLAENDTDNDIPTLIELLKSPLVLSPIASRFKVNVNSLSKTISIKPGGSTKSKAEGVLKVSMKGRKPKDLRSLLAALSQVYLQAALDQRQAKLSLGIAFLDRQAPALQQKADQIQAELADFRRENSLLEPLSEGAALKLKESSLNARVLSLEAERNRLLLVRDGIASGNLSARGFKEAIGTGPGEGSISSLQGGGLSISDADQSLLKELLSVETDLANARAKFQPDSSMVTSLEARLDQLKPLLQANQLEAVDAALTLNQGRLSKAKEQELELTTKFLKKPALIMEYQALQSRLNLAKENLTGLVTAREAFQLDNSQQSAPWRIISPPKISSSPIKPSFSFNLTLGAILGLVFGVLAALIRDRFSTFFHSSAGVEKHLHLPVLADIPSSLSEPNPCFSFSSLRQLASDISFSLSDSVRIVSAPSSLSGEGSTTANILLAQSLLDSGRRVLSVDFNFMSPALHEKLDLPNLIGLNSYLSGEQSTLHDIIQPVQGYENWSAITAGPDCPDLMRNILPIVLIRLFRDLRSLSMFDLVILDLPPLLQSHYSSLIASHCDSLYLLVGLRKTSRQMPVQALSSLRKAGAPVAGLITNTVDLTERVAFKDFRFVSLVDSIPRDERDPLVSVELVDSSRSYFSSIRFNFNRFFSGFKEQTRLFLAWVDS